jgi:hypothetical protein
MRSTKKRSQARSSCHRWRHFGPHSKRTGLGQVGEILPIRDTSEYRRKLDTVANIAKLLDVGNEVDLEQRIAGDATCGATVGTLASRPPTPTPLASVPIHLQSAVFVTPSGSDELIFQFMRTTNLPYAQHPDAESEQIKSYQMYPATDTF